MSRRVVVTGTGVLSPLGGSAAALHAALRAGTSALKPISSFSTAGLPSAQAGEITGFDPRDDLGDGNLRPLDRLGRLVAATAARALADAGCDRALRAEREVGLVLGTMFSGVRTIAEFDRRGLTLGPAYASPLDFANTVINAAAGQAAIWHDLRGVNSTLAGGTASGLQALAYGADLIRAGRCDALLAGGADEICHETFLSFCRTGRLCGAAGAPAAAERPIPFDARRNGFALAEGAAFLMLEEAESAARRGATVLAEVLGGGTGYDTSRGSDPVRGARAVARAVGQALAAAGVAAGEIDAVWAAANGSVLGDRSEAAGLGAALATGAAERELPVVAVKAMLGEALGASGALAAVDAVAALADGWLPGIAGLAATEEGFPLSAAAASRELALRCVVVAAGGLDGPCSALVLARGDRMAGTGSPPS